MSDEQLLEVIGERFKSRDKIELVTAQRDSLAIAVRGVIACFRSREGNSTCSEDHHPSCREYLELVLRRSYRR